MNQEKPTASKRLTNWLWTAILIIVISAILIQTYAAVRPSHVREVYGDDVRCFTYRDSISCFPVYGEETVEDADAVTAQQ